MSPFGEFLLSPAAILAWLVVGLGAGWLAGVMMGGSDLAVIVNLVVGLIGGAFGGFVFGLLVGGDIGFWGSLGAAFVGAGILIAVVRFLGIGVAGAPQSDPPPRRCFPVATDQVTTGSAGPTRAPLFTDAGTTQPMERSERE